MKQKIALGLAWAKVVGLGLLGIYALVVVILNAGATIEPALRLGFVRYEHPNALLTIVLASLVSVAGCFLIVTLYKSVRQLRDLKSRGRMYAAEKELAELKSTREPIAAVPPPSMSLTPPAAGSTPPPARSGSKAEDLGPVPLE